MADIGWDGADVPPYEFVRQLNFYPTHSQHGYLDIVNDLGFVGLMAFLGYLIVFVRQSLASCASTEIGSALFVHFLSAGDR